MARSSHNTILYDGAVDNPDADDDRVLYVEFDPEDEVITIKQNSSHRWEGMERWPEEAGHGVTIRHEFVAKREAI